MSNKNKNKNKDADTSKDVAVTTPVVSESSESTEEKIEAVEAEELPPTLTIKPKEDEDMEYKRKNNIPLDALLARDKSHLPRYFRQHDNIIFTHALPDQALASIKTTPIWFQVIAAPHDVEVLENLYNARMLAKSKGFLIVN